MKKIFLILLFSILSVYLTEAAITCSPSSISTSYTSGGTTINQSISCVNGANTTVTLTKSGPYFSVSPTSIGSLESKSISVGFESSASAGTYYNLITFDDGSSSVPVTLSVSPPQSQTGECPLDIFPTTLTNVKIPQGTEKVRQILITVPQCYPSTVTFRAVDLGSNVQPIELGELALGDISPGNSVQIPLIFNAEGIQRGTYFETLIFNLANSTGNRISVSAVSISVTVTSGITPITNETFGTLPTCSITSIDMEINKTEQLICNGMHPDIQVDVGLNQYIKGLRTDEPSGQWIWTFQPVLIGNGLLEWAFKFKGGQIGTLSSQEFRVTAGGQVIPGTLLDFQFFPSDPSTAPDGSTITVLAKDNKTNSIIANFDVYLNGAKLVDEQGSPKNSFIVNSGQQYIVSLTSPGYSSIEKTFSISPKSVSITISPSKEVIQYSNVTISTEPADAVITMNGNSIERNFIAEELGLFTISASYEGYAGVNTTLSVISSLSVIKYPTEDLAEKLKKGKTYTIELSKEVEDYAVYYREEEGGEYEDITDTTERTGAIITITPDRKGIYSLDIGAETYWAQRSSGFEIPSWVKWVAIIIIVVIGFIYVRKKGIGGGKVGYGVPESGPEIISEA